MLFPALCLFASALTLASAQSSTATATASSVSAKPTWSWTDSSKKMNGISLGNWLILERWMDEAWFTNSCGNESAQDQWSWVQSAGDNAATLLQEHYNSWITMDDVTTIAQSGFNMIRVPLGYWSFGVNAGEPYVSADELAQVDNLLQAAYNNNLYVMLDLHGLPGSQNGEQESGHAGPNNFYEDQYQTAAQQTVDAVISYIQGSPYSSIISGVAACNEPIYYTESQYETLVSYYETAYSKFSAASIPMLFHPGHPQVDPLGLFQSFINGKDPNLLILEIHPYVGRNSGNFDQNNLLQQVCDNANSYVNYGVPVAVTEWSLDTNITDNTSWEQQFYAAQVAAFAESAGGMFWSYKAMTYANFSDTTDNYLSSFVDLVAKGSIPLPSSGESVNSYISGLSNPCTAPAQETWAATAPSVQPSITAAFTASSS